MRTLNEIGLMEHELVVTDQSQPWYHPGRSGSVYYKTDNGKCLASFAKSILQLFQN